MGRKSALPVFNHDNPEVREYYEIAEYWIKFGIDGWRLDVPFEVRTPVFGRSFVIASKPIRKLTLLEVWEIHARLDGTQFDVMNYLFAAPTIAFTAGDRVVMDHARPLLSSLSAFICSRVR